MTAEQLNKKAEEHFYQNNNKGIYQSGTSKDIIIAAYTDGYNAGVKGIEQLEEYNNSLLDKIDNLQDIIKDLRDQIESNHQIDE